MGAETSPLRELLAMPLRNGLTRPKRVRGAGALMVNMGELFRYDRIGDIQMDRVPLAEKSPERDLLEPGDLLFARQSLVAEGAGKVSIFVGASEPVTFESHLIRARPDRRVADPSYLYYYFASPQGKALVQTIVNQVAAAGIRGSELAELPVPRPPILEQRAMASVLGALDDKIESNRRVGDAASQAAAMLVRQTVHGMPEIPLADVATVTYGAPFASSAFTQPGTGLPLMRIRDLKTCSPSVWTVEDRPGARLVEAGDIAIGMDREFRAYVWAGAPSWLNQRVCAIDPRPGVSKAYLLEVLKTPLALEEATKSGTTVIHLGKRDIDRFTVPSLDADRSRRLIAEADPVLALGVRLRVECAHLTAIRDALLPKLVSGQIRVPISDDPGEAVGAALEALDSLPV